LTNHFNFIPAFKSSVFSFNSSFATFNFSSNYLTISYLGPTFLLTSAYKFIAKTHPHKSLPADALSLTTLTLKSSGL